tara:strand:+ start:4252 stop:4698 length:447 start_codon:yes stop_codon:yes gene_type:complete
LISGPHGREESPSVKPVESPRVNATRGSRGGDERIEEVTVEVMVEASARRIVDRGVVDAVTGGKSQVVGMAAERAGRNFSETEEAAVMMTGGATVLRRRLHLRRVLLQELCPSKRVWMDWPRKSWPGVERIRCLIFRSSFWVPGSASM